MARTKGGRNRYWSKEEKVNIIERVIKQRYSISQVAQEKGIDSGMIRKWIKKYEEQGESSLENYRKPTNPLIKYYYMRDMSDIEKLQYENVKLKIENEILERKINCDTKWYSCNIQKIKQDKFEIVLKLSKEYNIKSLCEYMNISRSGYYKWLRNKDKLNRYEINRLKLKKIIESIHKRKPSYGYRRINRIILRETGLTISNNLVHKICKSLDIKSCAKHYKYKRIDEKVIKYPNIINGNWTVSRPFEKVVSDTTTFYFKKRAYDWTFYLDVFNGEIIGSDIRQSKQGCNILNHKIALKRMIKNKIKRGYKNVQTILHTDHGSIYSSVEFNSIFKDLTITRSMSKEGMPTDNPIIESKNGWLKKEMIDFDINSYNTVEEFIEDIIKDNNEYRPSYALNYKTPIEYRIQLGFK